MQSNSNTPVEQLDMKRAAESDEDECQPGVKRSHQDTSITNPSCVNNTNAFDLLRYSFFLPLLLTYLSDGDVFNGLLPTMKAIKPSLRGYVVKKLVPYPLEFDKLESYYQQLELTVSGICYVPSWPISMNVSFYEKLSSIEFHRFSFNMPLEPGALPSNLTYLHLGEKFSNPIPAGILPASLKSLVLSLQFDHPIEPGVLPSGLESIEFGSWYMQPVVAAALPASLKCIIHQSYSSSALFDEQIYPAIESLSLLCCDRPPNFASSFPHLTSLKVQFNGYDEFGPNALKLPPSLKRLDLLGYIESITLGMLPDQLEYLNLPQTHRFSFPPGVLPASLKVLKGPSVEHLEQGSLPSQLEVLEVCGYFGPYVLPSSLRSLKMIRHEQQLGPGDLPQDLTELSLCISRFCQVLPGAIPNSVKKLKLDASDYVPPGLIPTSVTNLTLMLGSYDEPLSDWIPPNLIPSSVTHLEITTGPPRFVVSDTVPIPSSVTHLKLAGGMTSPLVADKIPASVTHIAFGSKFDQKISVPSLLTGHLQYLELSCLYSHFSELEVQSTVTVSIPDKHLMMAPGRQWRDISVKGTTRVVNRSLCWPSCEAI